MQILKSFPSQTCSTPLILHRTTFIYASIFTKTTHICIQYAMAHNVLLRIKYITNILMYNKSHIITYPDITCSKCIRQSCAIYVGAIDVKNHGKIVSWLNKKH